MCVLCTLGESSELSKASRVSQSLQQAGEMHEYPVEIHFHPLLIMDKCDFVCVEVLPTGEGDVLRLSKDSVPSGETGGSSACLPQKLLPL